MQATVINGIVEQGRIRIVDAVALPEKAKVIVVVLSPEETEIKRFVSPHLVNHEDAQDFVMDGPKSCWYEATQSKTV